ncbi:MAG: hypothetical protein ACRDTA_20780 [Pseudonocardiaceae bacterium]
MAPNLTALTRSARCPRRSRWHCHLVGRTVQARRLASVELPRASEDAPLLVVHDGGAVRESGRHCYGETLSLGRMRTDLPAGAIRRLTEHYGPSVRPWFDEVNATLVTAAERWKVKVSGYHDAGWTSVVALGTGATGQRVLIKASPDVKRYEQERAALLH